MSSLSILYELYDFLDSRCHDLNFNELECHDLLLQLSLWQFSFQKSFGFFFESCTKSFTYLTGLVTELAPLMLLIVVMVALCAYMLRYMYTSVNMLYYHWLFGAPILMNGDKLAFPVAFRLTPHGYAVQLRDGTLVVLTLQHLQPLVASALTLSRGLVPEMSMPASDFQTAKSLPTCQVQFLINGSHVGWGVRVKDYLVFPGHLIPKHKLTTDLSVSGTNKKAFRLDVANYASLPLFLMEEDLVFIRLKPGFWAALGSRSAVLRSSNVNSSTILYGRFLDDVVQAVGTITERFNGPDTHLQYRHTVSTQPGFSGAPMFVSQNANMICGLHIGASGTTNIGVSLAPFARVLAMETESTADEGTTYEEERAAQRREALERRRDEAEAFYAAQGYKLDGAEAARFERQQNNLQHWDDYDDELPDYPRIRREGLQVYKFADPIILSSDGWGLSQIGTSPPSHYKKPVPIRPEVYAYPGTNEYQMPSINAETHLKSFMVHSAFPVPLDFSAQVLSRAKNFYKKYQKLVPVPSDEDSLLSPANIKRVSLSVNRDARPGVFWETRGYTTKGSVLDGCFNELCAVVSNRARNLISSLRTKVTFGPVETTIIDKTPQQLVEGCFSDVVNTFLKQEAHSKKKISEGRIRIIQVPSLVDEIIDRLLNHDLDSAEIASWETSPAKPGIGFSDEKSKALYDYVQSCLSEELASTDISHWDWSLTKQLIEADDDLRQHAMQWLDESFGARLARARTYCQMNPVYDVAGMLLVCIIEGRQLTGCKITASRNTRSRLLLALCVYFASVKNAQLTKFPGCAQGDDALEKYWKTIIQDYGAYGYTLKDVAPVVSGSPFEFCSHVFLPSGKSYNCNPVKSLVHFASLGRKLVLEPLLYKEALRFEFQNHPDVERILSVAEAVSVAAAKDRIEYQSAYTPPLIESQYRKVAWGIKRMVTIVEVKENGSSKKKGPKQTQSKKKKVKKQNNQMKMLTNGASIAKPAPYSTTMVKTAKTGFIHDVCSITDPFCYRAKGQRYPDGISSTTLAFQSRGHTVVATNTTNYTTGNLIFFCANYPYPMLKSLSNDGSTWTMQATFSAGQSAPVAPKAYRLVSWGIIIRSIYAASSVQGMIIVSKKSRCPTVSWTQPNALFAGSAIEVYPLFPGMEVSVISRKLGITADEFGDAKDNVTAVNDWETIAVELFGCPATTNPVVDIEWYYNYEFEMDTNSTSQGWISAPTPAAPRTIKASQAVTSTMDTIIQGGVAAVEKVIMDKAMQVASAGPLDILEAGMALMGF